MILQIQRGLAEDGFEVAISKLCRWFGVPRRDLPAFFGPSIARDWPRIGWLMISSSRTLTS